MANPKLVELYAALLVVCTALIIFGIFQVQATLSAVVSETELSPLQTILQGIQIAEVGLILSDAMLLLFFRRVRKRQKAKARGVT